MRTKTLHRRLPRSAAGALLAGLVLTGCAGYQTDPGVQHHAPSASRDDIITKIGFVSQDQCYTRPAQHGTERCERYVAQVRNIALSATESTEHPPQITASARELQRRVEQLLQHGCFPPRPAAAQECTDDLIAVDQALEDLRTVLAATPAG